MWPIHQDSSRLLYRQGNYCLSAIEVYLKEIGEVNQFCFEMQPLIHALTSNGASIVLPWASYQIRKIAGWAGDAGNVFPATDFKRNRQLATAACITAHAIPAILRIWQKVRSLKCVGNYIQQKTTITNLFMHRS